MIRFIDLIEKEEKVLDKYTGFAVIACTVITCFTVSPAKVRKNPFPVLFEFLFFWKQGILSLFQYSFRTFSGIPVIFARVLLVNNQFF